MIEAMYHVVAKPTHCIESGNRKEQLSSAPAYVFLLHVTEQLIIGIVH